MPGPGDEALTPLESALADVWADVFEIELLTALDENSPTNEQELEKNAGNDAGDVGVSPTPAV